MKVWFIDDLSFYTGDFQVPCLTMVVFNSLVVLKMFERSFQFSLPPFLHFSIHSGLLKCWFTVGKSSFILIFMKGITF